MASSEFILAPRIDEAKARQEMQKLDDVARRTALQMTTEFDHAWDTIGRKGQSTFHKLGKHLQGAAASMVGNIAANVMMKAAEVATDAATKVFQDLEATKQIARERYGQNRDINSEADALGIGRGKYAALDIAGVASGLDRSDVRGLMSGFVGALEKPEMERFKEDANKNGIDKAFFDFIGSTSKLKPEEAAQRMNDVFGDEDALKASKFIRPIQDLMKHQKVLNFQNIVDNTAGRHIDIKGLETSLNMSEEQMKDLFANDARLLEEHIKGVAKQNNARNIATSDNSTDSVINAHLNNLHIKVYGQLIADGLNKAEINTGSTVVNSSASTAAQTDVKKIVTLWDAGGGSALDPEAWSRFSKSLISFINEDPNAPMPKKSESVWEYFNRNQEYREKTIVELTEQAAENNKNRRDTGPLK